METGIKESKTLIKIFSCDSRYKLYCRKWNLTQKWDSNRCRCAWKNPIEYRLCKKDYA